MDPCFRRDDDRVSIVNQSNSSLPASFALALARPIVRAMRVSIITGGGSGIGAAVARRLAGPDACLMLHGQGHRRGGARAIEGGRRGLRARRRQGRLAHRRSRQCRDGVRARCARRARRSGTSTRSSMPRGLPTGAVSRSCRAKGSNGRSRSWPPRFTNWRAAALPDLTRGSQGRVVAISSFAAHRFTPDATYPGVRARRRPRSRCWSGVLRSSSQARAPPPTSSCPAIRARTPG